MAEAAENPIVFFDITLGGMSGLAADVLYPPLSICLTIRLHTIPVSTFLNRKSSFRPFAFSMGAYNAGVTCHAYLMNCGPLIARFCRRAIRPYQDGALL